MLTDDETGSARREVERKFCGAEVAIGHDHAAARDGRQQRGQQRPFLSVAIFAGNQFYDQVPPGVEQGQRLPRQRALPRRSQFRDGMLGRGQMGAVEIVHLAAVEHRLAGPRHGVAHSFADEGRGDARFETVELVVDGGRGHAELILSRQIRGMDRLLLPGADRGHDRHELREQQLLLILPLSGRHEDLIESFRPTEVFESGANHHRGGILLDKSLQDRCRQHPCSLPDAFHDHHQHTAIMLS